MAERVGVSASTVLRIWRKQAVQPSRSSFITGIGRRPGSEGPDLIGVYLNPPTKAAAWLLVNRQSRALDRAKPSVNRGHSELRGRNPSRRGLVTLFSLLNASSGPVTARRDWADPAKHHKDFLRFLHLILTAYPHAELCIVIDEEGYYTNAKVNGLLRRNPQVEVKLAQSSGSWLNQIEGWYVPHAGRRYAIGGFRLSRPSLPEVIQQFLDTWDDRKRPLYWVKAANEIYCSAVTKLPAPPT